MQWWHNLKRKWGIASNARMAKLWVVFALTGSASAWASRPLTDWLGLPGLDAWLRIPLRLVLIFPFYSILLLLLGSLAGEQRWYGWFVRRMWRLTRSGPPAGR